MINLSGFTEIPLSLKRMSLTLTDINLSIRERQVIFYVLIALIYQLK